MNYTKEQLNVAKNILLSLISEDREIKHDWKGICYNAENHKLNNKTYVNFYNLISQMSNNWPKHSGYDAYPIQNDYAFYPWEGKNLELRIDLMKYIVSKIDILLGEMV